MTVGGARRGNWRGVQRLGKGGSGHGESL